MGLVIYCDRNTDQRQCFCIISLPTVRKVGLLGTSNILASAGYQYLLTHCQIVPLMFYEGLKLFPRTQVPSQALP